MDNLVTSNIRQRPIRTLVSVAGIALGVALVMLFTGLARGMSNDLHDARRNVRAELIFMRPGAVQLTATTANLDTRYVDRLKAIEGVEEALPVIRNFSQGTGGFGIEQIDGVEWDAYARMNGISFVAGRAPQGSNEVVIDETKARNNNLHASATRSKPLGDEGVSHRRDLFTGIRRAREDVARRHAGGARGQRQVHFYFPETAQSGSGRSNGEAYRPGVAG